MPTKINQIDHAESRTTSLRVEGEMFLEDAILVERIAHDIRSAGGNSVIVDLADLDFLDSDAAAILRRLADVEGFSIEGMEIFLQSAINSVERHGA